MSATASPSPPHQGCSIFMGFKGTLEKTGIHRFVLGEDAAPRMLSHDEAAAELGDPFAQLLLLQGVFPETAGEVLQAIENATEPIDPLRQTHFFLLGEGSQIPADVGPVERSLRFVVSCGAAPEAPEGPDIILSAFQPDQSDVELMAWDRVKGGFNFYRTLGHTRAWIFAGNAHRALAAPTEGNGPFEAHPSGALLMKELRFPWINWHSPAAPIVPSVFEQSDPMRTHPWFANALNEPGGAYTCEDRVAKPAMARWAKARFDAHQAAGAVADAPRILRQVLESAAVNLITSQTESGAAADAGSVDLPQTFFIDSEALTEILGLPAPPAINVPSAIYLQALQTFAATLTDGQQFSRPGDTHFAFCVPERAHEDQVVIREALRVGLLTERLVAALLMVDFPNPIFSERRAALLAHAPATATLSGGSSGFSQQLADTILQAAEGTPDGSPEREFAELWGVGEDWRPPFGQRLQAYYDQVIAKVTTQDGFDAFVRLAESRRDVVRAMPIFESPLLFAETNVEHHTRRMRSDATVEEV